MYIKRKRITFIFMFYFLNDYLIDTALIDTNYHEKLQVLLEKCEIFNFKVSSPLLASIKIQN